MADISNWFLHEDGRMRAGWRFLIFIFLFLILLFPFEWAAGSFVDGVNRPSSISAALVFSASFALAVLAATWMMMRIFERHPLACVGWRLTYAGGDAVRGICLGVGLVALTAFGEWAAGSIHFQTVSADEGTALSSIASVFVLFLVSAWNEEMLFRGYAFQRIVESAGGVVAVVLSSIIFGMMHWHNPHATFFSTANTVLAGILLSIAYLRTRALWLPLGFHFGWNWCMFSAGLPVSGMEIAHLRWRAVPVESLSLLSGGQYGPEGGAVATVALILGVMILWKMPLKKRREADYWVVKDDWETDSGDQTRGGASSASELQ